MFTSSWHTVGFKYPYERSLLNDLENQVSLSLIQSGYRRVNVNNDTKCVCVCVFVRNCKWKRTRNMLIFHQSLNSFCSLRHIHESFEWKQTRTMHEKLDSPLAHTHTHFIYRWENDVISFNRHIEANTS